MPADPAVAEALRAAQAALKAQGLGATDCDTAAAIAAFLRALPDASLFIHGQPLKTTNCLSVEEVAQAVERAAMEDR